ncbi:MAG: hypothetical protein V1894_03650 [Chloroflexota bacterium]
MTEPATKERLELIYTNLLNHYGPQHWWPGEESFEVMVGAVLTQSCNWGNVVKAINNLKKSDALSPQALRQIGLEELSRLIRPSGYHNAKALKLKTLAAWLGERCHDNIERLANYDTEELRRMLLAIYGIGEETADSILLYALGKPVFVIDTYTRRILNRLGIKFKGDRYRDYQALFMAKLPHDTRLFNEYHALLVRLGKDVCRKEPACPKCCLAAQCNRNRLAGAK